jgi:hypothetical protein
MYTCPGSYDRRYTLSYLGCKNNRFKLNDTRVTHRLWVNDIMFIF